MVEKTVFEFNATLEVPVNHSDEFILEEIINLCEKNGWKFNGGLEDVTDES